ncbi:hypothetical protein UFB30_03265 [Jeotgalibacillus sp. HH7-29]|uniref:Uncharacterized protein n=1 Tax=Jeotgalibacillus haloalkalitolerans TaxID=3104292 RepID=A0ABU5KJF3_9BACL|nr:hypothetical protein [Jeotgalibacillus sp. HH7-29]
MNIRFVAEEGRDSSGGKGKVRPYMAQRGSPPGSGKLLPGAATNRLLRS